MALNLGSNEITNATLGSTQIEAIYQGTTEIWSNGLKCEVVYKTTSAWPTYTATEKGVYLGFALAYRGRCYASTTGTLFAKYDYNDDNDAGGTIIAYLESGQTIRITHNGPYGGAGFVFMVVKMSNKNVNAFYQNFSSPGNDKTASASGTAPSDGVLILGYKGDRKQSYSCKIDGVNATLQSITNGSAIYCTSIKKGQTYSMSAYAYNYGYAMVASVFKQ